ncbi:hypothetical protein PFLmoz3_02936 [Pseudomonas fluorescens]|uniref:Uncharacterized protein n=1 Tax=Pseudomonas fluorescens TaxID=294 RepID=A0A109LGU9_PSEFL|nr:hypothetical protein PFLmoz3_02936 [Pseudomonas fluorescens]
MVQRQQLRAARATPAIKLERVQAQHIHTKTDCALGEPGLGVENETLRPLLRATLSLRRIGVVAVEEEITQVEVGAGVFEKAVILGENGQGRTGDSSRQQQLARLESAHGVNLLLLGLCRWRPWCAAVRGR